ncbi:MAG: hypothetical protein ACR2OV_09695 [Hyphomicrobiaceae bacterium]
MSTAQPLSYSVEAYNLSHSSENKIHDDTVARQFGFSGGLVPGVEVFAYASQVPLAYFGPSFLERGRIECRFLKPVYDGKVATVTGTPAENDTLDLLVESDGIRCAAGQAAMTLEPTYPSVDGRLPVLPPDDRPPADETSLAVGRTLWTRPGVLTVDRLEAYLRDAREQHDIYRKERLAHCGLLLRLCNDALKDNVELPPWIHTGSNMQLLGLARVGDELLVRATVVANYDRKGHRFVDLDCQVFANGDKPIAQVDHTAIYRLRQSEA